MCFSISFCIISVGIAFDRRCEYDPVNAAANRNHLETKISQPNKIESNVGIDTSYVNDDDDGEEEDADKIEIFKMLMMHSRNQHRKIHVDVNEGASESDRERETKNL